jgi:heterodisulfide reductase subunit A-like polyferredoxin
LACSNEGSEFIHKLVKEQKLDQLVLGACSCCSLDQVCYSCTYQRIRCKENLGVFNKLREHIDLEFVNIREQCAWVHSTDKNIASAAAETLIRSTLSRLDDGRTSPLVPDQKSRSVAVIGSSPAAEISIDLLGRAGIETDQIQEIPKKMLRTGGGYLIINNDVEVLADLILLAPRDKREFNRLVKAHQMLNGLSILGTMTDQRELLNYGVVICPLGLKPEEASEGAVAQIISWMIRLDRSDVNNSAVVDPLRCRACATCQEVCGFGIPGIVEDSFGRHAEIDPQLCLGCGICAAQCPSGAITPGFTHEYVLEGIFDAILG